jgi:single-strand DNA-binding protein
MASVNRATILGRVGKDVEVRYTPSGSAVASISVATSRQWKDKESGERKEEVEWHALVAYDRLAEIAGEYLKKGQEVFLEGRLKTSKYTNRDGVEKYKTEIVVENLQMVGGRPRTEGEGIARTEGGAARTAQRQQAPTTTAATGTGTDDTDDSIPF